MVITKFNGAKIILQVKQDKSYFIKKKSMKSITPIDLLISDDYSNSVALLEEKITTGKFKSGLHFFNYNSFTNQLVKSEQEFNYKLYAADEQEFVLLLKEQKIKPDLDKGYYIWCKTADGNYEYGKSNFHNFPVNYTEILSKIIDNIDISIVEFFNTISNDKHVNYIAICDMLFKHMLIKNKSIYDEKFSFKFSPNHETKLNIISDIGIIAILTENPHMFDHYIMILREFKNIKYNIGLEKYSVEKLEKIKDRITNKIKCKLFEL